VTRTLFFTLFFACLGVSSLADTIELANGSLLKGELVGRSDGFVAIARIEGRSAIERRVKVEEIVSLDFSDAFSKQEAIDAARSGSPYRALSLLEPLVKRRSAYIDLIAPSDQSLFALALEAYAQSGRENDCLEQAKLWLPKITHSDTREEIELLQIEAAWQLDRREEAAFYANRWIESGKSAQNNALAWRILAANALEAGDPERALWIALNPIVFSRPKRPQHLDSSYEIAIVAASQLGRRDYAKNLLSEMRSRELAWPIDSKWAGIFQELEMPNPSSTLHSPSNSKPASEASSSLSKLVGHP